MNDSDKYIIDTFFDSIKQTKDEEPYLYKILSNEFIDQFYIELYDKNKFLFTSKVDLKNALKKNIIDVYNIVIKRKDIFDKIVNKQIKLIDLTNTIKRNLILNQSAPVNLPSNMFKTKTASEALKEKLFQGKNIFHPSQLEKKVPSYLSEEKPKEIKEDEDRKKVEKVKKDLSVLFGDKKTQDEIEKLAEKLIEQQPDKVKSINIKLVEDLVQDSPKKEKEKGIRLKCKDGKILNKFTNKCVNEDSASGIFMKSKNSKLDEVTKDDFDKYSELKLADLKKICKTNAPNISCDHMETKKQLYNHIFNNINIHNNKLLCEDGKVYYHDVKECIDKREFKKKPSKKEKKSSKTSKSKKEDSTDKPMSPPKSYKTVDDRIREQIKENLRKKKPIKCKDDEVYNKFTDKCVKKNSITGAFLMSNYGNLNNVTKNDLKKFNQLKREDLDKLCKKFSHIGCNFSTKEELARHILDNVRLDKNELFCQDNKVYYHDVKKCVDRRLSKSEKLKQATASKKEVEKESKKEAEKESKKEKLSQDIEDEIYKKYAKMLIKDAYDAGFINKENYENTNEEIIKLIKFMHKDIIKKLNKQFQADTNIKINTEKSKDFYEKLIKEVYKNYYNKMLVPDENMKDLFRENIFVDVTNETIDKMYEYTFRDIIIQLLFQDKLSINDNLNLNFNYQLKSPQSKIVKVANLSPSSKVKSFLPDIKTSQKLKTLEEIVLEMISNGNKDGLIGNKIKKNTTVNYITKLLENMKKSFYNSLKDEVLTTDNKKYHINKFMNETINDKIDTISNNLISSCLTNMTLENSRKWLNKYLPIAFYQIV